MQIAGIITEYNPLHSGHLYQMTKVREHADASLVCVMSGNFVQRGDAAILGKHARAEAAVRSGADLVLELPLPWAVSSAEGFAWGGVQVLEATGVVNQLVFGSESGDAEAALRVARVLRDPAFSPLLKTELAAGVSFAAARQAAAKQVLPASDAALLGSPNDLLGVEYCKSLLRCGSHIQPLAIRRRGAAHDGETVEGIASASAIRLLLRQGRTEEAVSLMAPAMAVLYRGAEEKGQAPVLLESCERAVLARLRTMSQREYLALEEGAAGLGNRFYAASRRATNLADLLAQVKTKRYAHARLRRMVLWAYLGLIPDEMPKQVPYLRVLAANAAGCRLLGQMRKCAALPVLTKPADVRLLSPEARRLFDLEVRATDLYTLAYPQLTVPAGSEWREGPVIL